MNPPQPPQAHRPSTTCPHHPQESFTGFCPSCLCERLSVLDPNNNPSSSARKPPSSAAASALKSLFRPELRRTKSFSASKNEPFPSSSVEPQRKSCDVRTRNTLSTLFHQDLNPPRVVLQPNEKPEHKEEEEEEEDREEISALEEEHNPNVNEIEELEEDRQLEEKEQEELVAIVEEEEDLKTMKDHIDMDSTQAKQKARDFKDIAGSFFSAASVFSKKLQKWRQKQKMKKRRSGGGGSGGVLPVEKPIGRQFRDTQSEIADYGFGRRSCDTDPRFSLDAGRFSLDAGRVSFDDPRYSLDEPRASWDGYLVGRTGFPRMPTMLSVVEDAPVVPPPPVHHVVRTDMQIPVEEPTIEDESVPGGSAQTREYYSDSSSRRRKSLDRSSSARKSVSLEVDELSNGSGVNVNGNGKVGPNGVDYVQQGVRMGFNDREFDRSSSMREDCCSEKMFDVGVIGDGNGNGKGGKKGRRWRWSIWGFIHRRGGGNKDEDEDRYSRVNGVERSYSESWGGDGRGVGVGFNGRMLRSNSSVSWRNAQGIGNGGSGGGFGGFRRNGFQGNGNGNGKKGKDEFVLERNRSARYSPNNIDNGLLRFYLTPMRGSRRNGSVKVRSNQAHSIARSVLGLY